MGQSAFAHDCVVSLQASSGLLKHKTITQMRCCGLHNLMCARELRAHTHTHAHINPLTNSGIADKGLSRNERNKTKQRAPVITEN